jgi:signal transduction histidine kinase
VVLEAPDGPVRVRTDAAKLRQVVLNLLSNAVKFSPAGQVVVRVARGGAAARVEVEDRGIGIAAEDLERIWLPFTQVEGGTTRRFDGAGLGLAISRELASRLGGTLTVESTPGRGSTFTCTLPVDGPDAAE